MDRLISDGIPLVFGNGQVVQNKNELLNHLKAELSERPKIERVFMHFVFMGGRDKAQNSQGLEFRKEAIEKQAHLVQEPFVDIENTGVTHDDAAEVCACAKCYLELRHRGLLR